MRDPDDNTFDKLLAAIRREPGDALARGVLCDRLHELGEYELEAWWRGGAEAWMRNFASQCIWEYSDPPASVGQAMTYEQVMEEADNWIEAVEAAKGDTGVWGVGCRFSDYQLTTASELLYDEETDKTFWRAYETIRGVVVNDYCKRDGGNLFNCTC